MTEAPVIEFLTKPEYAGLFPEPKPAAQFVPNWFKSLDRETGIPMGPGQPGLSVRACMPVTDCFTLGYIIPLPVAVSLEFSEGGRLMRSDFSHSQAGGTFSPLMPHLPQQIGSPNPPFETQSPLKFMNPWLIRVPEGYSVLFVHPMNHSELPFCTFAGLVDCDHFETTVNFPFVWTGKAGRHTLEQGTPIVQVIPVKRADLVKSVTVGIADEQTTQSWKAAEDRKHAGGSVYRREWRQKK